MLKQTDSLHKMGRADQIEWTPELEHNVLSELESGSTLRKTGSKYNISASAIIRHVQANEDFAKQYARAMEIRTDADCDALADEITQEPETTKFGVDSGWVAWQRLRVDTMKWLLSKRNPKKYGEKIQQEHSGEVGIKTVIVTPDAKKPKPKPEIKPDFAKE